jgi:hypothetical protein
VRATGHDRLITELERIDHPFARVLLDLARRHQRLERDAVARLP